MSRVQVTQLDISPGVIDLGVGQPDPALLPLERMREAEHRPALFYRERARLTPAHRSFCRSQYRRPSPGLK
jgi:DNA-binding transcriptional MocR family regulator